MKADDLLELITDDIVIDIMAENGSPFYGYGEQNGQTTMKFMTICHGGDSPGKLLFFPQTKTFYCYTNCGAMSFFTCIRKILNISEKDFYQVVSYVASKCGVSVRSNRQGFDMGADTKRVRADIDTMQDLAEEKALQGIDMLASITQYYDESILNYFDKDTYYQGWIKEGISPETMKKYEISYYWLERHIIIPHRDIEGNLIGVRRRSLKPEDSKNKYMPEIIQGIDYRHQTALALYGLYQNQDYIRKVQTAVIVEGEKSVLKADTFYNGKSDVVATCGFKISEWQIKALQKLGVDKVFLAFDKDFDIMNEREYEDDPAVWNDYMNYKKRIMSLGERLSRDFTVRIILDRQHLLDLKDSPLDKGKEVFEQLKLNAKPVKKDYFAGKLF